MDGTTHSFIAADSWSGMIFSGGWRLANGGVADVTAPGDGSTVATVGNGSAQDVTKAAAKAREAQPAWEATPAHERARILNAAADQLQANGDELIPWIIRETGSIHPKAAIEVEHSAGFLRAAAAAALEPAGRIIPSQDGRHEELLRVAHGVVGVISPFNFPLILSVRAIAAALATGNAVVHKPDPRTPISGGIIIARIFEEAGLPANLLHIIPGGGDVGAALCENPDIAMVSFTGSPEVGSKVGEACGRNLKKVQLELGGKNALIILDDADFTAAAANAAWGTWLHQGQICMATGLILAPAAMADKLAEELAAKAARLPVGNPASDQCALGPLISDHESVRIKGIVDDAVAKGANLLAGGTPQGRMFPATVLSGVKPGMRAFEEEIFGPVAVIVAYDSDDHAVELANMSDYGLAAGIIAKDLGRARAIGNRLRVGHLHINDQTVMASPFAPFGGRGRSGNGSRISGPAIWEEFTQWVWVTTRPDAVVYPF
ncbi:aldehyde dehydrogenase family protein [Roseinatronobacter alkalisoli]|uniref:Aldehyde dehydrogenase family protein n=1 Tax=Roseinatronobacter alkalisoli TaxID=3028235 RepID=A0ABT5TAJ3_9RHOB|nr:aldehyde dehydrogenase family protein [Roseinatronobacter sp. HJB301]MDD7970953.1 aldehyde dehydrogenase family protein [Roseinatronobacter sp. HJB301]